MPNIDIKLTEDTTTGFYDINIDDNGDFVLDDSFDTATILSLFTDARADESQITVPERRRGWWGNLFNDDVDFENGSLLWLLEQAKKTQNTLNSAVDFAQKSLNWFVTDGFLKNISVSGVFIENGIKLNILLLRNNDKSQTLSYQLWQNSEFLLSKAEVIVAPVVNDKILLQDLSGLLLTELSENLIFE